VTDAKRSGVVCVDRTIEQRPWRIVMKSTLRFVLVIVSVAAVAAPALAQHSSKGERKPPGRHPAAKMVVAAPPARAPVRSGTDWDFLVGVDRASSPYGHDGF
jgi:hypothetical protein